MSLIESLPRIRRLRLPRADGAVVDFHIGRLAKLAVGLDRQDGDRAAEVMSASA